MKRLLATAVLAVTVPTAAFAGDDGDRCAIRNFGGEWLTAIATQVGGVDADLACRIAVDRTGKITASSCLKDNVNATPFQVTGAFTTGLNCRFKGSLVADGIDLTIDGEISKGRDVMSGLVFGADGEFKPIVLLRSAELRPGRQPKPDKPGEDDDDDNGKD